MYAYIHDFVSSQFNNGRKQAGRVILCYLIINIPLISYLQHNSYLPTDSINSSYTSRYQFFRGILDKDMFFLIKTNWYVSYQNLSTLSPDLLGSAKYRVSRFASRSISNRRPPTPFSAHCSMFSVMKQNTTYCYCLRINQRR